jgi:repressor of nif and glnA expression
MADTQSRPPTNEAQFGYTIRQLNLAAIRYQTRFGETFESLNIKASLNVAQIDDEVLDIPVQEMSPGVLLGVLLNVIAANNYALDEQLRDLGLVPRITPEIPSIEGADQ